jgi:Tol biopolymer transport system component
MTLSAGARLGPYEVVGALGAGGMGEVYRARDTRLERTVALKVLPSTLAADADRRARFEREARAVSSLNHPHICTLHDIGRQDGIDFLVMEYLEGETLADRLKRGPLPTDAVLRYAVQIADALDKAHRQGVIHRDLKPGNVMLTKTGPKLLDFGLAKLQGPQLSAGSMLSALPTGEKPLTEAGTLLGTFQYMAPEQLEGKEADARTDIFAFGAVVYEMATGRRAFEGKSQASLIAAILEHDPPPMTTVQPLTPPALDRVVRTCLAKDPDERWQNAHDVMAELRWIAEGAYQLGIAAPVVARHRGRERLAWALAAAGLAAALGTAILSRPERAPAYSSLVRAYVPAPAGMSFAFTGDSAGPVQISSDGTRLAFVAEDKDGQQRLWTRPVEAAAAQPLAGTEGATFPFWSADGRSLGFFAGGKLKRVDLSGGAPLALCDVRDGRGGAWSRQGIIVFAPVARGPLFQIPDGGGEPRPVTSVDPARHTTHRWPVFLADGRHFLYLAANHDTSRPEDDGLYVGSLDGGASRMLMRSHAGALAVSGYLLFIQDSTLFAQRFDDARLGFRGEPIPVAQNVTYDRGIWRAAFDASSTGLLAYQAGGAPAPTQLTWFDANGKTVGAVGEKDLFFDVRLSPDGRRLAAAVGDTSDVWIYDLVRNVRSRFSFDPTNDTEPVWSPDGTRIAFASDRVTAPRVAAPGGPLYVGPGRFALYMKPSGGGRTEERLLESTLNQEPSDWSPDGRFLAFVQGDPTRKTREDIWILPMTGERKPFPYLDTEFTEREARFSPDGRFVAYTSDESGRRDVYVTPFPEPRDKWQVSPAGGRLPIWRRDGSALYYLAPDNKLMGAAIQVRGPQVEVGTVRPLFATAARRQFGAYDVSPDGRFLINAVGEQSAEPITLVVNWTAALKR